MSLVREAAIGMAGEVMRRDGEHFSLVSARVENAVALPPAEFERQTFHTYIAIADALSIGRARHAVRFWNHVPAITDPAGDGRDNYMVFNAGRYRAMAGWYGCASRFERDVATATGVGHAGRDLIVHCLAAEAPASPVNNPRQVAPYHYSQRFGPLPPCFARATRLRHPPGTLLVGGTASVRGEDSVHVDDLPAQCEETLLNLASLVVAAVGQKLTSPAQPARWLDAFDELRIYHPRRGDRATIESALAKRFGHLDRIEWLCADLCRAELRVEIEGIASLTALEVTGRK